MPRYKVEVSFTGTADVWIEDAADSAEAEARAADYSKIYSAYLGSLDGEWRNITPIGVVAVTSVQQDAE